MSQTADLNSIFQTANKEGALSQQSLQALNLVDHGAAIQAGLGVDVGDIEASEVVLVTLLIDDSGSIAQVPGNADLVRGGHNDILSALRDSKQSGGVLVSTRYLNGQGGNTVFYPFTKLKDAPEMNASNFAPFGATPLNDQAITTLGQVLAKTQEFSDNGVSVRSVTAFISDGADTSSKNGSSQVKTIVEDMLRQENHAILAMGISDGSTDFNAVFTSMGIKPEWILTPGNSPKEIRRAFQTISQSAVRLSQAANFSGVKLGGFGG